MDIKELGKLNRGLEIMGNQITPLMALRKSVLLKGRFTHVTKAHERKYSRTSLGHGRQSKDHDQEKSTSLFKALIMGNGVKWIYTGAKCF